MSPLATFSFFTAIGCPGTVRRLASVLLRTATWSDSGMPSSIPITRMGSSVASSAMMSKPSEPTSGSRQRTQYWRTWSSSAAMRRGVNTRDMRPRCIVCTGGSSKRITPGRQVDAGADDVEDVAAGVGEVLPGAQRRLDVGVARQHPEVVAVVVVDRRLVAQPGVGRVRVGVDLDVVGVEVDVGRLHRGHVMRSRRIAVARRRPPNGCTGNDLVALESAMEDVVAYLERLFKLFLGGVAPPLLTAW